MNFVRGIRGQRNQDYTNDAQQSYRNNNVPQPSTPTRDEIQNKMEAPQTIRRVHFPLIGDSNERRLYLLEILNLHVWKALLICFTTISLFGAQIRDLFFPKSADLAVDIVFFVVVCFFWMDTIFRMDCETNYFQLYLFSSFGYSSGITIPRSMNSHSDSREVDPSIGHCIGRPFHIGSFLFWCDVIANLALLREISLVDFSGIFDEARIEIYLDDYGMPMDVSKDTRPSVFSNPAVSSPISDFSY